MFQIKHGQYPEIVSDIFAQTTQYSNFRQNRDVRIRSVKSVYHGSESIYHLRPKIWKIVPAKMKETNSLNSFKIEIREWVLQSCPCRLCRQYITGVGFFFSNISQIMSFLQIYLLFLGLQIFDLFYTFNFLILNFTCVRLTQISILFLV